MVPRTFASFAHVRAIFVTHLTRELTSPYFLSFPPPGDVVENISALSQDVQRVPELEQQIGECMRMRNALASRLLVLTLAPHSPTTTPARRL